jgi:hypothetical protein
MLKMSKRKNNLVLIVAVCLLMISLVFVIIALNMDSLLSLNTFTIPAKITVGDHHGIDAGTDALGFGNISHGSFGTRNMTISNNYDFPVVFEFNVKGNISDLLLYPESVYLDIEEQKNVTFSTIFAPDNMKGYYSGIVTAKVKKAG